MGDHSEHRHLHDRRWRAPLWRSGHAHFDYRAKPTPQRRPIPHALPVDADTKVIGFVRPVSPVFNCRVEIRGISMQRLVYLLILTLTATGPLAQAQASRSAASYFNRA